MLMNLFSIFDPVSYLGFKINWGVLFFVFVFFFVWHKYYMLSGVDFMGKLFITFMSKMFKEVAGSASLGLVSMSLLVFVVLLVLNVMSLFPYVFTVTAHPLFSMGVSFIFWVAFFVGGWYSSLESSLAHLVPMGCPIGLAPLMVLIELVSHLIRPFTLAVRLSANMMAGHLIIGLLASISLVNISSFCISVVVQNVILILEVGVAFIQSFVFSILLMLYVMDYY